MALLPFFDVLGDVCLAITGPSIEVQNLINVQIKMGIFFGV